MQILKRSLTAAAFVLGGAFIMCWAVGIAGHASIGKVAGPVGGALIMIALGLATAVPAVLISGKALNLVFKPRRPTAFKSGSALEQIWEIRAQNTLIKN